MKHHCKDCDAPLDEHAKQGQCTECADIEYKDYQNYVAESRACGYEYLSFKEWAK